MIFIFIKVFFLINPRTLIENSVSQEMDKLAQMHNTQFQLALGDNFYTTGIKNSDDARFKV